jgi:sugar lactone lactonase YvrE
MSPVHLPVAEVLPVRLVANCRNVLGEGPIWCPVEQALWWVDNLNPSVWRYTASDDQVRSWPMPEEVGCVVLREQGGLVAAMKSGFYLLDLERGERQRVATPETDRPGNRLNDGRCDRRGRFWCGSMNANFQDGRKSAAIYRLDPDFTCTRMDDGFIVSNGIAFSPVDRTMYYSDTTSRLVYRYDFDIERGAIANRRVFTSTEGLPGKVDGAAVDESGGYWCAHVYDWCVVRYRQDGTIDRRIRLPVRNPTCVAFGGPDLRTLYVTSAVKFLSDEELAAQPWAGGVLAIDLDVRGLPEPRFAG